MIRVENLRMNYRSGGETVAAARDVCLNIQQGQFYTLLGPSGCGKTTTLRCVAGLEEPDHGEISVGDEIVFSSRSGAWVPPHRRNIGMVFQSYAIWPHMSVFENVAFPLVNDGRGMPHEDVRKRVLGALAQVKLEAYANRPAPHLSGGQQQRLALARALVAEPRVLLLDEPLSNLDAKLREEMRIELRDLSKRLNVTTLFVTHEQLEALSMSDMVAVMNEGSIVQADTPAKIYAEPRSAFVAQFIGRTNIVPGAVKEINGKFALAHTPMGMLWATAFTDSDNVIISIRPEDAELVQAEDPVEENVFEGQIERVIFLGECVEAHMRVGPQALTLRLHPSKAPAPGQCLRVRLPRERCRALKATS